MANISFRDKVSGEEIIPLSESKVIESDIPNEIEEKYDVEKCIEREYKVITHNKQQRKGWRKYVGLISALAAGFLISVSALSVKMLQKYHPFTVSLWRYGGNMPPVLVVFVFYLIQKKNRVCQNVYPLVKSQKYNWSITINLLGNGILAWICVNLRFYSLQFLTLDTTVIAYSSPVFVVIFAHFYLKEKCGVISVLLSVIAVIGVAVISRPPLLTGNDGFDNNVLAGTALAVGSMLAHTCICIFIRKSRKAHFSVVLLVHGICGFLFSCLASGSIGEIQFPEGKTDTFWAIIVVLSGFGTQVLLTLAFKFEEAAPVSLILCLEVILTFVWQYIFLDTTPDLYSLIGSTIILLAVCLAIFRKCLFILPEDSLTRKQFCILLK